MKKSSFFTLRNISLIIAYSILIIAYSILITAYSILITAYLITVYSILDTEFLSDILWYGVFVYHEVHGVVSDEGFGHVPNTLIVAGFAP